MFPCSQLRLHHFLLKIQMDHVANSSVQGALCNHDRQMEGIAKWRCKLRKAQYSNNFQMETEMGIWACKSSFSFECCKMPIMQFNVPDESKQCKVKTRVSMWKTGNLSVESKKVPCMITNDYRILTDDQNCLMFHEKQHSYAKQTIETAKINLCDAILISSGWNGQNLSCHISANEH